MRHFLRCERSFRGLFCFGVNVALDNLTITKMDQASDTVMKTCWMLARKEGIDRQSKCESLF